MSVLPHPGPPQIKVGLPLGKPPSVISSRPSIPVGVLGNKNEEFSDFFDFDLSTFLGFTKEVNLTYLKYIIIDLYH